MGQPSCQPRRQQGQHEQNQQSQRTVPKPLADDKDRDVILSEISKEIEVNVITVCTPRSHPRLFNSANHPRLAERPKSSVDAENMKPFCGIGELVQVSARTDAGYNRPAGVGMLPCHPPNKNGHTAE